MNLDSSMTTVNTSSAATSSSLYAAKAAIAKSASDNQATQDQFLKLLVTQLQNQDPLNPMDNAQVTSQMAQLSTVNGIEKLNTTLLALSGQMDVSQAMQAGSLVGKDVLVPGDKVKIGSGLSTPYGVDVLGEASTVMATILDGSGATIRTLDLGARPMGVYSLEWDGKSDAGVAVSDGAYTVKVDAKDASGAAVAASPLTYGKVGSVAYTAEGMRLDLGMAGNVAFVDLRKVM